MDSKSLCSNRQGRREISDDVLLNVLSRLPVRSLCRSKCVSKLWNSLIKDPLFIIKPRPKSRPHWIRLPPPEECRPARLKDPITKEIECAIDDVDIHIYSIDDSDDPSVVVQTFLSPPDTFQVKHYTGLICSYQDSSQLTVFNTVTRESVAVYLPIPDSKRRWNFEFGFDPLSNKYKVLSYEHFGNSVENPIYTKYSVFREGVQVCNFSQPPRCAPRKSNFEVLTLGGDNPTWRSVKNVPKIKYLSYWVINVDGRLFWFNDGDKYRKERAQIISFNLAKEEFTILKLPNNNASSYFKSPLFEFEGTLCMVEKLQRTQLELNVWVLRDIENGRWKKMGNFTLCLVDTNLRIFETQYYSFHENCSTLTEAEFCAQNGELLITVHDKKDQYLFSCNFLNGHCKRMKIGGQLIQHLGVEQSLEYFRNMSF